MLNRPNLLVDMRDFNLEKDNRNSSYPCKNKFVRTDSYVDRKVVFWSVVACGKAVFARARIWVIVVARAHTRVRLNNPPLPPLSTSELQMWVVGGRTSNVSVSLFSPILSVLHTHTLSLSHTFTHTYIRTHAHLHTYTLTRCVCVQERERPTLECSVKLPSVVVLWTLKLKSWISSFLLLIKSLCSCLQFFSKKVWGFKDFPKNEKKMKRLQRTNKTVQGLP